MTAMGMLANGTGTPDIQAFVSRSFAKTLARTPLQEVTDCELADPVV